jgi:hypothetical protein
MKKRGYAMKKFLFTATICLVLASTPVFAHHPTEEIVSEDIFEMIDTAVSETPHADMLFDEMETAAAEMTGVKTRTIRFYSLGTKTNTLVLFILNYASILEGDVEISIEYVDEGATESIQNF